MVENVASKLDLSSYFFGRERTEQMLNFRAKIDSITTYDSYAAWREGQHDDLVLSVSLAAWWGENRPETTMLNLTTTPIYYRPPSVDGEALDAVIIGDHFIIN